MLVLLNLYCVVLKDVNYIIQECQQQIENYKEQMNEEGRRYMAEKRELQEGMKSFKIEIKSLNEKSEK